MVMGVLVVRLGSLLQGVKTGRHGATGFARMMYMKMGEKDVRKRTQGMAVTVHAVVHDDMRRRCKNYDIQHYRQWAHALTILLICLKCKQASADFKFRFPNDRCHPIQNKGEKHTRKL